VTAPDGEEIGVFVVLAKIQVIEEVAFHQSGVFEGGKLEISRVGFRRGKEIVFGLLGNLAIGNDKKGNGEKPEKVRNDEACERKSGGFEVFPDVFLLTNVFNKEGQKGDEKDEENGLNVKGGGGEEGNEKKNQKINFSGFYKVSDGEKEKPREGTVEPGKSFEGDKKGLESGKI